ncbi:MAG: hypothetical protein ACJ735_12505 [Actinomycetes bacterium]
MIELTGIPTQRGQLEDLWLEVMFDFLGTTVCLVSANIEHIQHWCAVYSEFRVPRRSADVTVRVSDRVSKIAPRGVTLETGESISVWDGRAPLMPPLRAPGLDRYIYLQGAATGRAGHAALMIGGPRSGRTTLATSSAARGARLLADDLIPLDPDDLLAMPWPKALALPSDVLVQLGVDPSLPGLVPFVTRAGDLRWRIAPSALFGKQLARVPTDVAAVVFMEPTGQEPTGLSDVSPGEAFERLVRHLEVRPVDRERTTDALVRLCRRVPTLALRPSTPADDAALIDALLR